MGPDAAAPGGAAAGAAALAEHLQCTICYEVFHNAVVLDTCGHSFCAGCVSSYFAGLLRQEEPLRCPFRCELAPLKITSNRALRDVVGALGGERAAPVEVDGLVPLYNDRLPFWLGALNGVDARRNAERLEKERERAALVADLEAARAAERRAVRAAQRAGERRHAEAEAALVAADQALAELNDKWIVGAAMAVGVGVISMGLWMERAQATRREEGRKRHDEQARPARATFDARMALHAARTSFSSIVGLMRGP